MCTRSAPAQVTFAIFDSITTGLFGVLREGIVARPMYFSTGPTRYRLPALISASRPMQLFVGWNSRRQVVRPAHVPSHIEKRRTYRVGHVATPTIIAPLSKVVYPM
jgi:hypothetical protein